MDLITTRLNADFDGLASMVAGRKLYPGAVLAKDLALTIVATTRNPAKVEALRGNGADHGYRFELHARLFGSVWWTY